MGIKKWLIRGAGVAGGFIAGAMVEGYARDVIAEEQRGTKEKGIRDVWEGKTYTWQFPVITANDIVEITDYEIGQGWWIDHPTYQDDLKSLRLKFSHGIAEAEKKGHENVSLELSDRERLVLYHVAPDAAHAATNNPIREDFLERSE